MMVHEQFSRNIGVLSEEEMAKLQASRIVIAGCGCIGGFAAELLVRMGVGAVTLADPDVFDISNINRQCAATYKTVGQPKAYALRDHLFDINPELRVKTYTEGVHAGNVEAFLDGADYVIDAIDYFEFPSAIMLHRKARSLHLNVVTAVALGFGTSVLTFKPDGLTLEEYIGIDPATPLEELGQLVFPAGNYASQLPAYATPDKIMHWINAKTIPTISVGQALGPGCLVSSLVLHVLGRKMPRFVPDKLELQFEL